MLFLNDNIRMYGQKFLEKDVMAFHMINDKETMYRLECPARVSNDEEFGDYNLKENDLLFIVSGRHVVKPSELK